MPTHTTNLLTFILEDFLGYKTAYYPLRSDTHITATILEGCKNFLCFSGSHVWAYRHVSNRWYCIDSLSTGKTDHRVDPTQLSPQLGYIFIYDREERKERRKEKEKESESEKEK